MGCTPSKPSKAPQKQISRPIHPHSTTKPQPKPIYPSARRTLYQSPHHTPCSTSEKARMNAKALPLLPSKAELRSKGHMDAHGKIIINPQITWNRKKTMPRPYPGQVIKRKPVPEPAGPVKAPSHAARTMQVQQQSKQRKVVEARPAQVPREIKRVAANHGQQKVAFLDGKWVGPADGKNGFAGYKGYMVQRHDGKWVPAKEVMRGRGGKEVVHAGGWF